MLQETIKLLSNELYTKDIHFFSELLQNAEDNTYSDDTPSIEILLTSQDVTGTKAPATLLLFNNEVGFSEKNIEALCGAGLSSKKGKKAEGYIGEKGIGFKSVFLVSKQPYVISNGFRIRFSDDPDEKAGLGYIVPEWVDEPCDKVLQSVYGSTALPMTIIILPLREDKVAEVELQLNKIPAETVLFLSKISYVTIRNARQASSLSISRTTEMTRCLASGVTSSVVFLEVDSNGSTSAASYYMFTKTFEVPQSAQVKQRQDVHHWTITLGFPIGKRIWSSTGDVFAFLPSDLSSGFPFLINSDFLMVSSRESIQFGSPWNKGIMSCIPELFVEAFTYLLSAEPFGGDVPSVAKLAPYGYVPIHRSNTLEDLRCQILSKLKQTASILCRNREYCIPAQARKADSDFRYVIEAAPNPPGYIVDGTLQDKFGHVLTVLGVPDMTPSDCFACLNDEHWIASLPSDIYVRLLLFLVTNRQVSDRFGNLKFFKYLDANGQPKTMSMKEIEDDHQAIYWCSSDSPWLSGWMKQFKQLRFNFVPEDCAREIRKELNVQSWLETAPFNIKNLDPLGFATQLMGVASQCDAKFIILATHFFFDMYEEGFQLPRGLSRLLPIVSNQGDVVRQTDSRQRLVPGCVATWPLLIPDDTWSSTMLKMSDEYMASKYIELSQPGKRQKYLEFLREELNARDIPEVAPINEAIPAQLLVNNTQACALLLKWILRTYAFASRSDNKFLQSIQSREWMKTTRGYRRPTECFLQTPEILQHLSVKDVPFIEENWLPLDLKMHKAALKGIGVATSPAEGYGAALEHLVGLEGVPATEVDPDKLLRLYTYLSLSDFSSDFSSECTSKISMIWLPATSSSSQPSWRAKEKCIIYDEDGLAGDLGVVALSRFYKGPLELFFKLVGVARNASVECYRNLWLRIRWGKNGDEGVPIEKCHTVWKKLVSSGKTAVKKSMKVPSTPACGRNITAVKLLHAEETLVADSLELEYLFKDADPCPWVAWYPSTQDIDVPKLYEMYSAMGVKKLSESVQQHVNAGSLRRYGEGTEDEGYISRMCRAVYGYLVVNNVSRRQELLLPLMRSTLVEIEAGVEVQWTLEVAGETSCAKTEKMVIWNRDKSELAIVKEDRRVGKDRKFCFEISNIVAAGVLGPQHEELVAGLQELLRILAISKFCIDDVEDELRHRNCRLLSEDEAFLETGVIAEKISTDTENVPETYVGSCYPPAHSVLEAEVVTRALISRPLSASGTTPRGFSRSAIAAKRITILPEQVEQVLNMHVPPPDKRVQLLKDAKEAMRVFPGINISISTDWMMELSDETFDSEQIISWRKSHLPTVRQTLGYPPEEGILKPGMRRTMGEYRLLDKLLTAAFMDRSMYPAQTGASHEHLGTIGKDCLKLCLDMQLVHTDPGRYLGKLTSVDLLAECFRASGLDKCILFKAPTSFVDNFLAATSLHALLAVGYCAYDDGVAEVQRLFTDVFISSLESVLG